MGQLNDVAPDNFLLIMSYLFYGVNLHEWFLICSVSKSFNHYASVVVSSIKQSYLYRTLKWCSPSMIEILLCKRQFDPCLLIGEIIESALHSIMEIDRECKKMGVQQQDAVEILTVILKRIDKEKMVLILNNYGENISTQPHPRYTRFTAYATGCTVIEKTKRGDYFISATGLIKMYSSHSGSDIWLMLFVLWKYISIEKLNEDGTKQHGTVHSNVMCYSKLTFCEII